MIYAQQYTNTLSFHMHQMPPVQNIDFQQDNNIYNPVTIIIPQQSPSWFVLIEKKKFLFHKGILLTLT